MPATLNSRVFNTVDDSGHSGPSSGWSFGSGAGGMVSGFAICGCCGRLVSDGATDGHQGVIVNIDNRGNFGPNGKPSLSTTDAGLQITRGNQSWVTTGQPLGTPATVTFAFRASATTMPTDTAGFTQFTAIQIAATLLALRSGRMSPTSSSSAWTTVQVTPTMPRSCSATIPAARAAQRHSPMAQARRRRDRFPATCG